MPLTAKGETILAGMKGQYGEEKGARVFYASKNVGTITGVDTDEALDDACAMLDAMLPYQELKDDWRAEKINGKWYAVGSGIGGERLNMKQGSEAAAEAYAKKSNAIAKEAQVGNATFVAERKAAAEKLRASRAGRVPRQGNLFGDAVDAAVGMVDSLVLDGACSLMERARADSSPEMQAFMQRQAQRRAKAEAGELKCQTLIDRATAATKRARKLEYTITPGRASNALHDSKMAKASFGLAIGAMSNSISYDDWMSKAEAAFSKAASSVDDLERDVERAASR